MTGEILAKELIMPLVMGNGFLVPVAASIVLGFGFVRHSKTDAAPFVPYRLLRGRGFGLMNAINYLNGAARPARGLRRALA